MKIVQEEDLNLQDLIFILLFFFIIAQTLIVFKLEKDVIVPPSVDKKVQKAEKDDDEELITILIDNKSNIVALVAKTGRTVLAKGLETGKASEVKALCNPFVEDEVDFLESEDKKVVDEIVKKLREIIVKADFHIPRVGLIADHRARYGAIFQLNLALKKLIDTDEGEKEPEIMDGIKWKVREESDSEIINEGY